ncbi:SLC13 family permease [Desulforhabdus sp. TSK]|uniref:SLC13 family permease n=1 Tax=Desulforhabdus sp. TSK TaxID=2925014 RepID=UPI001FC8869B|nr:ArsB/NhaD family transporter [Desulforhabdus sp. TSK]GKT08848.1 citrate transporter [Desulforhabdus sp. TSK]
MKRFALFCFFLSLFFIAAAPVTAAEEGREASGPQDTLIVAGTIVNSQGKPIKEVAVHFYVNGVKVELEEEVSTSKAGRYEAELFLPRGTLPGARVEIEAGKPAYKTTERVALANVLKEKTDDAGNVSYLAHHGFTLQRAITPAFWIATLVLLVVYALIAFELMHRTLAAFLGASVLLFITYLVGTFNSDYVILTFEDAMHAIDMNVIFLLMAMMMIVGILKKTGVFQWMAYKAYQLAKGNVYALASILMVITAVASAFLDNVTTMLLIIPVTIEIALTLKIDPVAFLMPEVFASNVGGTATLIGDPPNIMIGSYAKLSFVDFVQNLSVICAIGLVFSLVYFIFLYKKDYLKAQVGDVQTMIAHLREEYKITNKTLLIQGGITMGIVIALFIAHGALHMEPSIAAMVGAAVLMAISRVDIVEMIEHEIEWPTLIFFIMLFIVVAGAEESGLIQVIAEWVKDMSQGSLVAAILMILWVSAIASAFIDNIPFTATMLPIVAYLNTVIPGAEHGILWWALALGACLGGNGTMIGASANVVTVGMAERAGYHISFMKYIKIAAIPTLITIILCTFWLLVVEI